MLAKEYIHEKHDVLGWFISEKYDGYRACFDGIKDKQFYSTII